MYYKMSFVYPDIVGITSLIKNRTFASLYSLFIHTYI